MFLLLETRLTFLIKQNTAFCSKSFFWKKELHNFTSLLRKVSNSKQKIRKSAFGNKHLKLIMSDGCSSFSHSVPFSYGNSAGSYNKRLFLLIGKCLKENSWYYTCNILFFYFLKCGYIHLTYFPVLMLYCWDKSSLWNAVFYSAYLLSCWRNLSK